MLAVATDQQVAGHIDILAHTSEEVDNINDAARDDQIRMD